MPIVEIGTWIVSDSYLEDPTIVKKPFQTVREADGCLGVFYGLTEEDPKRFYLFVVWKSLDHHIVFTKLPVFLQEIQVVVATQEKDVNVFHVDFHKDLIPSFLAPATQIVHATLRGDASKENLYSVFEEIAVQIDPANDKYEPVTWGKIKEESSKYVLMVGWESSETHREFASQRLLKDLNNVSAFETFHIPKLVRL